MTISKLPRIAQEPKTAFCLVTCCIGTQSWVGGPYNSVEDPPDTSVTSSRTYLELLSGSLGRSGLQVNAQACIPITEVGNNANMWLLIRSVYLTCIVSYSRTSRHGFASPVAGYMTSAIMTLMQQEESFK